MHIVLSLFPLDPIGLSSLLAIFAAMFALGASIHPAELLSLRGDARAVVLTLVAALVLVPVVTLGVASVLDLHSAVLAGVLLVGISPGAPLALRRAQDAGAHVPFALIVQVLVALLAIVTVPAWILILDAIYDRGVAVSVAALAKQVFMAQLLPLCAGLLFAKLAPAMAKAASGPLLRIGGLLIIAVAAVVLWATAAQLTDLPAAALLASATIVALALALGHAAAGPNPAHRTSGAIISALRNPGIAILIASANGLPGETKVMVIAHVLVTAVMVAGYLALLRRTTLARA